LKARALPFETFEDSVDRIAPAAGTGEVQRTVSVYCSLDNGSAKLMPGMTGYARACIGRRPIGEIESCASCELNSAGSSSLLRRRGT
jgi:hypothetical protein